MKKMVPQNMKNIYHLTQAVLANFFYGFPARKMKVIGVTGTNGKTTTCQMIAKIIEEAGKSVAMASTINFKLGKREWVNATKFTTLSSFQVQKFIRDAAKAGCEYLVLEVSSHSLDQYRVWGIRFKTAVITNITREHLDYHETMEEYRLTKLKLFRNAKIFIVNLDMDEPEEFLDVAADEKYGYSTKISNFQFPISNKIQNPNFKLEKIIAEEVELNVNYSKFKIQNSKFTINLPGLFNVENALAATCVGLSEGIDLDKIKNALEKIKNVPGRLENVENNRGIKIIVDYAVTPDSLEKLYAYLSSIRKEGSKIISILGACGERDRGKRPIMGKIVGKCADYVIVTNEDPYGEDPEHIINEVFSGVVGINGEKNHSNHKAEKTDCWRILDRREAIRKALALAKPGDIVVVTGKGAEEIMMVGKKRIPWNDKKVIREELDKM
jgi:UDP-N-acetylmuramoyl-L-alanyl-D-glutamate--2,6-diaminopimelate ligase